jgi:undecaprenyl diphosphate synthase
MIKILTEIKKERNQIDPLNVPKHVAIIMDGNRRWAEKNNLPSSLGHIKGAKTLTNIVKKAADLNIKILTVFAFSTENWKRSEKEIKNLMKLFHVYLKKQLKFMQKENVKLSVIGDLSMLEDSLQKAFEKVVDLTKDNNRIELVIAINYGSRDEIRRAFKKILDDYDNEKIAKTDISEDLISKYLDTNNLPDPDLLIRTSSEKRISNFMLWQIAYSEIYISNLLWPEFNKKEFMQAILDYQNRKRRQGK